jgi:Family of unknown function (DUF6496)
MTKPRRKYSPSAAKDVEAEMRRYNLGIAKSGRGGKVKSRKQAIAIACPKRERRARGFPGRRRERLA